MDGDAPVEKKNRVRMSGSDWKLVFNRKLVGVYLGQFSVTSTLWFFLTWFPNYLTQEKHIAALTAGFMTTVPFLAAFFGVILSGYFADRMVRAGKSLGFARKTPIICGLLLSTCIMGANYTNDRLWIMVLMALAYSISLAVWAASPYRWWWAGLWLCAGADLHRHGGVFGRAFLSSAGWGSETRRGSLSESGTRTICLRRWVLVAS